MITINEFFNKYKNKAIDFDGVAGVQCVDLAKLYLNKVFGIKSGAWGNAKDWWIDRNKNTVLKKNFDFILIDASRPYAKTTVQKGDIGIRTSGTYGHIFVIDKVKDNILYYYDFNGTGHNDPCTRRGKPFTNYYITGILRKKTTSKTVNAKGGLHFYKTLADKTSTGTIPNKTKIKVIVSNAGTKIIDDKQYKMAIIWYKGNQYYSAEKYLK